MQGRSSATIGVTGHTTGPHVHLVTGIADPHGDKLLGTTRYRIVNPVTWYICTHKNTISVTEKLQLPSAFFRKMRNFGLWIGDYIFRSECILCLFTISSPSAF